MQHYALYLQEFNYSIKYKNTKEHGNADCLSRLPIKDNSSDYDVVDIIKLIQLESCH